jgi:hypothetical protein
MARRQWSSAWRQALRCAVLIALASLADRPSDASDASARGLAAVSVDSREGRDLVEKLRGGGFVLFFRHADTIGEPCDRSFKGR